MTSPQVPDVCILAGGLGSRLGSLVESLPKPLVEVAGEPFLCHQLRQLSAAGVRRVLLAVGYRGEQIEERIGSEYEGVSVDYSYDSPGLDGTLGALRRAREQLPGRFLVMYGDTYLTIDYIDFYQKWANDGRPAGMVIYRNEGRWDQSNVVFLDDEVTLYDKFNQRPDMRWIDYGLSALEQESLDRAPLDATDLAYLFHILSVEHMLFGYPAVERFYEIGTAAALDETERYLRGRADRPV